MAERDIFTLYQESVAEALQPSGMVLDIGTGDGKRLGKLIEATLRAGKRLRYQAIDWNDIKVEEAGSNLAFKKVEVWKADGRNLEGIADGSLDAVIGVKSCFVPKSACRALRQGGLYAYLGPGDRDWIELRQAAGCGPSSVYLDRGAVEQKLKEARLNLVRFEEREGTDSFESFSDLEVFWRTGSIARANSNDEMDGWVKNLRRHFSDQSPIVCTTHEWFVFGRKP